MWLSTITISKTGKMTGEASVKLIDEEGLTLSLNKILVDLTDGAEPVSVFKFQGTPIISGSFVDGLKETILEIFQEQISDKGVGLYQISEAGLEKL